MCNATPSGTFFRVLQGPFALVSVPFRACFLPRLVATGVNSNAHGRELQDIPGNRNVNGREQQRQWTPIPGYSMKLEREWTVPNAEGREFQDTPGNRSFIGREHQR